MKQEYVSEKIYFTLPSEDFLIEKNRYILFLRIMFDPYKEMMISDTTLEDLIKCAIKADKYLCRYIHDIDEEIEEFMDKEGVFSTEKGELFYYCDVYRLGLDNEGNKINLPPAPIETIQLLEYIQKEYTNLDHMLSR